MFLLVSIAALFFCEIVPQNFADLTLVGVPHSQIDLEKEELKKKNKKQKAEVMLKLSS